MAALGQTDDPKELIPGNPEAVANAADDLRKKADLLKGVGEDLGAVRISAWDGQASNGFWEKFTPEKGNWKLGHDSLDSAAKALDGHVSSLTWAQGQAREAIAKWDAGEQATKKAAEEFAAKGGTFSPGVDPDAPIGSPNGPKPNGGAFTDPGIALRKEASAILERAKDQLGKAGDAHAKEIEKHGGKGKNTPDWLAHPARFVEKKGPQKAAIDIKKTDSWIDKAQKAQGKKGKFGKYGQWGHKFDENAGDKKGPDVKVTVFGGNTEASLFKADAKGATQVGNVTLMGEAGIKALSADAGWSAGVSKDGVYADAKAGAYLVSGEAKGSARYGYAEVGGSVKGYIGAEAGAEASIGKDGIKAGVNAFAGGRAEAEVHGDVGGVGAGAKAEGWVGVGAEANATIGKGEDGKWTIGAEAGVGLGVGGKIGFEITVDPGEVVDTVGDVADKLNPFD
ncbi:hypothetical protein EV193_115122 [Herbihabitans rhizosphaerae]|uniref:Putative T7SS secretion signal domain-containing protein n=1 Tax=Herbihabitans rhizosphaerae TaxID=1872711 RepID=A0A4V2ERG6_9PSEU|nr:hypothetical protein [Herbihabitans rhizosphaerae]RZS31243.1 hypothetical protein EV193_115122 [Herbihabitans rhizosphaerae]